VGPRILIVDDYDAFRSSARALLESEGFDVVGEACNAAHALRAARELEPDIVLTDVGLPDFDGFELADRLRELEHAPVVVLTSSRADADFGRLIRESAADGFIAKTELSGPALSAYLP
jgi:CheY-like chemotaxis protein